VIKCMLLETVLLTSNKCGCITTISHTSGSRFALIQGRNCSRQSMSWFI